MAGIPQVITEDRASGAQFIDGSLKFGSSTNASGPYLSRTGGVGNRKTWTLSCWIKRNKISASPDQRIFTARNGDGNATQAFLKFQSTDVIQYVDSANSASIATTAKFRDTGWFHLTAVLDASNTTFSIYINGQQQTLTGTQPSNADGSINNSILHAISYDHYSGGTGEHTDTLMSQFYLIDGQALGPENFGFTDPLTNTWRPKKYEGDYNVGPASALNGVIWSNYITGNVDGTYPLSRCFGGTIGTGYNNGTRSTNPGTLTLSIASLNLNVTNVKLHTYIYNTPSTFTVNGTTVPRGSGNGDKEYVVAVNGQLNTVAWSYDSGNGPYCYMRGIEVDLGDGAGYRLLTDGAGGPTGVNSFYLPMDGNTPIGKDQSGNGNDWTPVGFGGSVELPKATGAIPILNTNEAGTVAKKGVRTDKKTYTVTASGGNYYLDGALKPTLNAYRGGFYTFDYTGATSHPFYLSSLPDGKWNSKAYSVEFDGTGDSCSIGPSSDFTMGTGDFTIECFVQKDNNSHRGILQICDTAGGFTTSSYGTTLAIGYQVGVWQIYGTGGNNATNSSSYPINAGQWYHIAYVRHNSVAKLYVDGSEVISQTDTYNYNGTYIGYGGYYNSSYLHDGKISNLRVVKGQALYTSNFTRPSTTLTTTSQGAIASNVKLLCCQDSDATTAAVKPGDITVNGDSVARNESPFLYNTNGQEGVNTGTSNTTKITIPHWAADTLYYYCNAHSGMGSSINVTTDIFKADPYAWKCVLANPLLGNIDDVSNQINFGSTTKVMTNNGSSVSSKNGNFYGGSWNFDYSDDYLSTPDSDDYNFGSGDFTMECWFYQTAQASAWYSLLQQYGSDYTTFFAISNNKVYCYFYYSSGNSIPSFQLIDPDTVEPNKWHHAAVTRSGNTFRLFINGILKHTQIQNVALINSTVNFTIGADSTSGYHFQGQIQDARVYKGVAKYTSEFIPASTSPDILPDTPSGITGKTNLTKITEGAVSFDGDGDYLSIGPSSDFDMDGDFTAEAWVYPTSHANDYAGIFGFSHDSDQAGWNVLVRSGSGRLHINVDMTYTDVTGSLPLNKWTHLALVRSGTGSGNCKLYIDGVADPTTLNVNNTTGTPSTTGCYVGSYPGYETAREFTGFISNARVIKGTALYTSDFTPPTEPLTEVTNTKLLCCQSTTSAVAAAVAPGTFVNDGTNYSSGNQVTGSTGLRFVDALFDGHLSSSGASSGEGATVDLSSDNYILWTPTTGIPYSSKVEVYCYAANGYNITNYYSFNGGTETTFTGGGSNFNGMAWITVATGSGTINSIKIRITRGSGNQTSVGWYAVKVDGTILINDYNGKSLAKFEDAAATTFNPFTDDINTIRGQASGYCTWNPLSNKGGTVSDGNLKYSHSGAANITATFKIPDSGKWFWEYDITRQVGGGVFGIGDGDSGHMRSTDLGWWSKIYGYSPNGNKYEGGGSAAYGPTFGSGDVLGVAYNSDTRELRFYLNGYDKGVAFTAASVSNNGNQRYQYYPALHINNSDVVANFGQKPFKFPPPDGYQPLNFSNVQPEKVIARPDQYVGVSLWPGNGTSQNITDLKHKPDFVWIKKRAGGSARSHQLFDSVRGVHKTLHSDSTGIEDTNTNRLTAFNQDGFAVGGDDGANGSSGTFVGWTWKAGGNKNTFNIDDVGYASASDVNMNVGGVRGIQNVTAGNDYQGGWAGPSAYWASTDSWSNLPVANDNTALGKEKWDTAETLSNGHTFAVGDFRQAPANGSGGFVLRATTTVTLKFEVYHHITEIAVTDTDAETWGNRTVVAINPSQGSFVEATGKCFWFSTNSNVPNVAAIGTVYNAPAQPLTAATGCSVGTKQGFSIVSYTSAAGDGVSSVPHGLSQTPDFVLIKNRDTATSSQGWPAWHSGVPDKSRYLDSTNAWDATEFGHVFDSTAPTSNVVTVRANSAVSSGNRYRSYGNGDDFIMYCWHSVPGLQKFGSYISSANANGPFVELGFRPAIVWIKNSARNGEEWVAYDNRRQSYNPNGATLYLNNNAAEYDGNSATGGNSRNVDFLSNGFKINDVGNPVNISSAQELHIYCAWAEAPSINLYGAQANAR